MLLGRRFHLERCGDVQRRRAITGRNVDDVTDQSRHRRCPGVFRGVFPRRRRRLPHLGEVVYQTEEPVEEVGVFLLDDEVQRSFAVQRMLPMTHVHTHTLGLVQIRVFYFFCCVEICRNLHESKRRLPHDFSLEPKLYLNYEHLYSPKQVTRQTENRL